MQEVITKSFDTNIVHVMTRDEAAQAEHEIVTTSNRLRALLVTFYERRGWEALGFSSWRAWAVQRLGAEQAQAYRELAAGQVEQHLSPIEEIGEIPERQIRPITQFRDDPDKVREVWADAKERALSRGETFAAKHSQEAADAAAERITQGAQANRNGRVAESIIAGMLDQRRIVYTRQHPIGQGIFDTPLFADFYLPMTRTFPEGLIIESKWQQVAGSTEEKLCYLAENILTVYPCTTMVIIDGLGFRPGAIRWLKKQTGKGRFLAALPIQEFLTWSNHSL